MVVGGQSSSSVVRPFIRWYARPADLCIGVIVIVILVVVFYHSNIYICIYTYIYICIYMVIEFQIELWDQHYNVKVF